MYRAPFFRTRQRICLVHRGELGAQFCGDEVGFGELDAVSNGRGAVSAGCLSALAVYPPARPALALAFVVWSAAVPIIPFVLLSAALDTGSLSGVLQSLAQAPWSAWAAAAYLGWIATIAAYAM